MNELSVVQFVEKGLTEEEAKLLHVWIEEGKPGLSQTRAEKMGEIYVLGYTCQEIRKWFPEYPIELLLYARLQYNWDDARAKYRSVVQQETLTAAVATRMEGVRFLSDLLSATHVKWRKELLQYIANPDGNKPPECIPKNLYVYAQIMNMLGEMMPKMGGAKEGVSQDGPLVSINVNNGENGPDIVISSNTQDQIKAALLDDVKADNKKKKR